MATGKHYLNWLIPLLLYLLILPFTPWIDLALSKICYSEEAGAFLSGSTLHFIYTWMTLPGQILIAAALIALIFSYIFKKCKSWRIPALYLVLTLAVGAGLITHAMLKDHWGRPRPRQVTAFGGGQNFRPVWKPNFFKQPEPSKSFPCGHCTMGFAFFAFYFLGKRLKRRWLSIFGAAIALILGITLGAARIAQGGHFFSDVLTSALILWLTAYAFDRALLEKRMVS